MKSFMSKPLGLKAPALKVIGLSALLTLAACGSSPADYTMLEQARARFAAAQAEAQVASRAPDELSLAHQSLMAAEAAYEADEPVDEVEHLAYLALQRVVIAQQTAAASVAQDAVGNAADERERLQLAAREAEVNATERQLSRVEREVAVAEAERAEVLADAASTQIRLNQVEQERAQATAELEAAERREQASEARLDTIEAQLRALNAQESDRGMVVTLGDVLFETGEANLLPPIADDINRLAEFMTRNPEQEAIIEGHTDNVGSESANYLLSERRAEAVKDELVRQGIESSRLDTRAYGPDRPIASNGTPTGRQMNRRVEVVFRDNL